MSRAQLRQYFKDNGITLREIAETTGYAYSYTSDLLNGHTPLTDSARFRFVRLYPETAVFLLPELVPVNQDCK